MGHDFAQEDNFPNCIPGCDAYRLALLDLVVFSDPSIFLWCDLLSVREVYIGLEVSFEKSKETKKEYNNIFLFIYFF